MSMRRVVIFLLPPLLVLTAVFFLYPPLSEETGGTCSALEQRVRNRASHDSAGFLIVGQLYGANSSEPNGAALAARRYPLLPAAVGCALAFWQTAFSPSPPPRPPAATVQPEAPSPVSASAPVTVTRPDAAAPPQQAEATANSLAAVIARGITPNGDPISPATTFTLPMHSVAIRVEYPNRSPARRLSFQLMQGRIVLGSCPAQAAPPTGAWCKFDVELRKGVYTIALSADRTPLGQFPFTVIGR